MQSDIINKDLYFTRKDVAVIADAFDKYGFEEIAYVPRENIFYILFQSDVTNTELLKDAALYISDKIQRYTWKCTSLSLYNDNIADKYCFTIVSYCGWKDGVCIDD